jgi:hypothetical protein
VAHATSGPDLWEYDFDRIPAGQPFEFKPLLNDARFSTGANYIGTGGDTIDITPGF